MTDHGVDAVRLARRRAACDGARRRPAPPADPRAQPQVGSAHAASEHVRPRDRDREPPVREVRRGQQLGRSTSARSPTTAGRSRARSSSAKLYVLIFVVAVAVLGRLQLFLSKTSLGRAIRATAEDPDTVELVGVNSRAVYALATALALATRRARRRVPRHARDLRPVLRADAADLRLRGRGHRRAWIAVGHADRGHRPRRRPDRGRQMVAEGWIKDVWGGAGRAISSSSPFSPRGSSSPRSRSAAGCGRCWGAHERLRRASGARSSAGRTTSIASSLRHRRVSSRCSRSCRSCSARTRSTG